MQPFAKLKMLQSHAKAGNICSTFYFALPTIKITARLNQFEYFDSNKGKSKLMCVKTNECV